jgi:hypothetical protein
MDRDQIRQSTTSGRYTYHIKITGGMYQNPRVPEISNNAEQPSSHGYHTVLKKIAGNSSTS